MFIPWFGMDDKPMESAKVSCEPVCLVYLVHLVNLVYLVYFVYFVNIVDLNDERQTMNYLLGFPKTALFFSKNSIKKANMIEAKSPTTPAIITFCLFLGFTGLLEI